MGHLGTAPGAGAASRYDRPVTEQPTPQLPFGLRLGDVLTAATTGLLTLPDPGRRSPAGRFAVRAGIAGVTGAAVWAGTGAHLEGRSGTRPRAALTSAAVGLAYGSAVLGDHLDGAIHRALVRRGVRRPRLAMAVGAAAVTLAMSVAERRTDDGADDAAGESPRATS